MNRSELKNTTPELILPPPFVNRTKYHFQHDDGQFVQHKLSNIWGE